MVVNSVRCNAARGSKHFITFTKSVCNILGHLHVISHGSSLFFAEIFVATFSVESNGRIEKTVCYFNGEQIGGIKEVFLNLEEDGTFDAVIQYTGRDGTLYNKQIFNEHLVYVQTEEPSFTEEEAAELRLLTVESNGDIENTNVFVNNEPLDGITSLFLHIKAPIAGENSSFFGSLFGKKSGDSAPAEFKAEITFRNEDDTLTTEPIF